MRKYSDPEWRFHHQLFVDTRDNGWLTSTSSHLGGFWPFVNIHCETGVFPGKSVSSVEVVLWLTKEVIFNQAFLNGTFLDSWSGTVHVFRYQSAGDQKKSCFCIGLSSCNIIIHPRSCWNSLHKHAQGDLHPFYPSFTIRSEHLAASSAVMSR